MNTVKKISQHVQKLPERSQEEVLDFIDFLLSKSRGKNIRQSDLEWYKFSLNMAMHGIEDGEVATYEESDLKEKWR